MTEYDFSPEAHNRFIATQERISRWAHDTSAKASHYSNPFAPTSSAPNPYFFLDSPSPNDSISCAGTPPARRPVQPLRSQTLDYYHPRSHTSHSHRDSDHHHHHRHHHHQQQSNPHHSHHHHDPDAHSHSRSRSQSHSQSRSRSHSHSRHSANPQIYYPPPPPPVLAPILYHPQPVPHRDHDRSRPRPPLNILIPPPPPPAQYARVIPPLVSPQKQPQPLLKRLLTSFVPRSASKLHRDPARSRSSRSSRRRSF